MVLLKASPSVLFQLLLYQVNQPKAFVSLQQQRLSPPKSLQTERLHKLRGKHNSSREIWKWSIHGTSLHTLSIILTSLGESCQDFINLSTEIKCTALNGYTVKGVHSLQHPEHCNYVFEFCSQYPLDKRLGESQK
jgi:hypothetical protein